MFELLNGGVKNSAKIKVIGIGGGGGNAVNTMISYKLEGVDFISANTDTQAMGASLSPNKIQLGSEITKGLGAGSDPTMGRRSAIESADEIGNALDGADMVFITAGLGGGTGTGGAPVVAEIAKDMGALAVAVVTKPFQFEGKRRGRQAEEGIAELRKSVDSLIVIPNQRLLSVGGRSMPLLDAFKKADEILFHAVKGISDLIMVPGLINLDFADVKNVMSEMGLALMGTGTAGGEGRSVEAAQKAISSPLLEDNAIQGARGILLNITGGVDITLDEVNEASSLIHSEAHEDANIIFGTVVDNNMGDEVRITVIATGFDEAEKKTIPSIETGQIPGGGYKREDMSTPAFIRKEKNADRPSVVRMGMIDDSEESDLEIPAFLRRQAD